MLSIRCKFAYISKLVLLMETLERYYGLYGTSFMTDDVLIEPRVCIICHASASLGGDESRAQALRQACTCRESVFCDECWRQYRERGFAACPVCREPIAAGAVGVASETRLVISTNTSDREEMTEC